MCMDLGFQLWNSPVRVTTLLQEVIAVYPNFLNSTLTMKESARISNALIVFQCMAYHPEARMGFLKAKIPYYLYPFFQISINVTLQFSILSLIAALAEFDKQYEQDTLLLLLDTQRVQKKIKKIKILFNRLLEMSNNLQFSERRYRTEQLIMNLRESSNRENFDESYGQEILLLLLDRHTSIFFMPALHLSWVSDTVRTNFPHNLIDYKFGIIIRDDLEISNMMHQLLLNLSRQPQQ
ncbi:uncharacterized protein [Solanum lycopersicum]|uniref:uncharacterized protein n=1 Tax=Solanum lycopersicum TaxID=4081 RepID=UPI00374930B2